MSDDQANSNPARDEASRQAVALAMMAVALPVLAWIERQASSPDTVRAWRMRAAKATERAAAAAAGRLWQVAEGARRNYESHRP